MDHVPRPEPAPETDEEGALDPADWDAFGAEARELVDHLVAWMAGLRERPVWTSVSAEARALFDAPLPREPEGLAPALEAVKQHVLAHPYGNVHPRFWGWVNGSALPTGILGDLVASTMNPNVAAFDHAATFVEEQVLTWMRTMLDYAASPGEGDGILTSGASIASLYGLACARTARADFDTRRRGLAGGPQLTVYASLETHSSVRKAVELLGIGSDHLRLVPVDAEYRVDVEQLERTIRTDREAGFHPLAVVGNAGTVNTGAVDDLERLADLCEREDLWLHVDGAFGALLWLVPEERTVLRGLQRADSLAFDLHKWMYLPSDVGCILVRDPEALKRAFTVTTPYLAEMHGGVAARTEGSFMDRGVELTRRFRALKVWLALKAHGTRAFEQAIRANLAQARRLARRVEASERLELCAPAPANVVCFRHAARGLASEERSALNRDLLVRLQEDGTAVPSNTVLGGEFALRVAITNHRTRAADVDLLVAEAERVGDELLAARLEPTPCGGGA
jgi:glutamate/tyrosine decarboxylase-like PLP-dependent enzyme